MAQQTAVEWLINAIDCVDIASGMKMHIHIPKCFIEQAKEMERQALADIYEKGRNDERALIGTLLEDVLKNGKI